MSEQPKCTMSDAPKICRRCGYVRAECECVTFNLILVKT